MIQDYIKTIRKQIGHDPLLSIGAGVVIENEKGEILLEKRKDNGLYCLPGGGLDLGEKVKDTAKREVYEETGIVLDDLRLFYILSGEEMKLLYPNGDLTYYVDFEFAAKIDSTKQSVKPHDNESSEIVFVSKDQLPEDHLLLRGVRKILDKYLSGNLEIELD